MEWLKDTEDVEWYTLGSYQLFGLPFDLEIDENLLEKRYIQISQRVHPDRNMDRPDWALLLSSRVNQAYDELTTFRIRAELFFREKTGNQPKNDHDRSLPVDFLERVFIWNEKLEDGQLNFNDVEDALEEVQDFLLNAAKKEHWEEESFRKNLNKLKYLENLLNAEVV